MATRSDAERFTTLVFFGTVFLIAWLAWQIVQPFILEIAWAVVFAICLNPLRERLEPRLGPTRTAMLIMAGVLVLIIVPALVVGSIVLFEGQRAAGQVRTQIEVQGGAAGMFHQVWEWARARVPGLPDEQAVVTKIGNSVVSVAQFVGSRMGSILASVAGLVFSLGIILGALFFILRDAAAIAHGLRRVLPFGREQNERMIAVAADLVSASVSSTLVIAGIQGVIGGITFAILGVPGAVTLGVMIAVMALLPLIGAAIVWVPAAVWLALTGHLVQGIIVTAVGLLVLGNVDNVVRPLMLSGKSQLNTLVLILSLMGGVSAFGFIGIVLGPLIAALLTAIVESYGGEEEAAPPPPGSVVDEAVGP